jgi:hypothetical protein
MRRYGGSRGETSRDVSAREATTRQLGEPAPTDPTVSAAPQAATLVLGRYRLTRRLGAGAFGSVWSARDERLDRDVAVKLLARERVVHARFEREARAAARLQHPGIVTLYEAAVDDHGAYLVSELVRGRTLDALLKQGRLSDRDILEIGIALCDALAHAHALGVVHRDVKPSNVLVPTRATGHADRAKLTDFGVAHVAGSDSLTRTGDVIGTLAYMAPEQADGSEVGPEADLYALALVLYEALSGVNPQGQGRRGRRWVAPPLRRQRRDLSRPLATGIDRALRERPRERGTLGELRVAIVQALDGAGTEPGVVAPGWGGHDIDDTWVKDAPGPEWDQEAASEDRPAPRLGSHQLGSRLAGLSGPGWAARAANAVVAGFGGAWICAHALHWHPLAPAVIVLIVALIALPLPLLGSLSAVVALGAVSLGGAYPAVVALVGTRWWQRAIFAAAGFLLLAGLGRATHHDLYWLPARLPPGHLLSLAGAGVWAVASALAPLLRTRRFPMLDVVIAGVWAAATVAAVQALGVYRLTDTTVGAVAAGTVLALPALLAIVEETRQDAFIHGDAA